MKSIAYPAMDGLKIPAFLTLPAAASRSLPTVIMIHGGPTARDAWAFDADVQLLASRGYAVLQPQFRGSSGFGRKFEEAGYGQWGLAMQDDITAGVDYLVKQQIADPNRVCIYGASYGGYAALWGLVKTPGLFKCGISFAGVVDLELMFKDSSDRTSNDAAMEMMRSRIGDPKLNKQQFDQVSPLKHAALIAAPVLLMHGDEDRRVPIVHGKKMRKALLDHGKQVEWLSFEGEGHGLYKYQSQQAYFKALLAFLDANIGSRALAARGRAEAVPPATAQRSTVTP
jgi:dipeptidyl aminopeptidase/acylaminoacyl peptidase